MNVVDLYERLGVHVGSDAVAELCRKYHIRELSLFGSAVRGQLRPDSDIDLLVDFEPDSRPGFLTLTGLAEEFSELLNRPVDVVPKLGLKEVIRDQVLSEAEVFYAA
jgi:predicted nucleotidyltransferase